MNSLESNILFYKASGKATKIQVIFNSETFWMSQKRMAELYGVDVRTINYHLGEIYKSGELTEEATIRKIGIVQLEGESNSELGSMKNSVLYNLLAQIGEMN